MEISMREIQLTKGKVAIVDDADFEWLSHYKWHAVKAGPEWYARRILSLIGLGRMSVSMHRDLLGLHRGDGGEVDHIDGNGLNNCRTNLRVVTARQNRFNNHVAKGYYRSLRGSRWIATIKLNRLGINLGSYDTEEEARAAYISAKARLHHIPTETQANCST
jgi:hypothetical protein